MGSIGLPFVACSSAMAIPFHANILEGSPRPNTDRLWENERALNRSIALDYPGRMQRLRGDIEHSLLRLDQCVQSGLKGLCCRGVRETELPLRLFVHSLVLLGKRIESLFLRRNRVLQ